MKSKLGIAVAALERISAGDVMAGQAEYTHGDTVVAYQRICREALAAIQAQTDVAVGGALNDALMRCCTDLPEGYGIVINVERGAGIVTWIDPDGDEYDIEGEGYLSDDVIEAYEACVAARLPGTNGSGVGDA